LRKSIDDVPAARAAAGAILDRGVSYVSRLSRIGNWLRRRAENILVILLTIMFVSFLVQVFSRYVLNDPVGWSEEVIATMWVWTVLWGSAFVLSEREEIRFDIIYSNLPGRVRRGCTVITGVVLIVLYLISLPAAYAYVSFMKVERSPYLHVPINWMYSIYVIFAVASIVRYCWLVYEAVRGEKAPETDPAALSS
jgi:TRAP-type C4-dicarboxylate transport system permease small subunit